MLSCGLSLNDECFFSIGNGVGIAVDVGFGGAAIKKPPGECTILDRVEAKETAHRKFFVCTKQNRGQ